MSVSDSTPALNGLRVLYLEDDAIISMSLVEALQNAGAIVYDRATIDGALSALQSGMYDVALLDVNVGGQMSYEVARAAEARGIPIVLVTGYGQEGWPPEMQHHVMCQKPFTLADLIRAINRALLS